MAKVKRLQNTTKFFSPTILFFLKKRLYEAFGCLLLLFSLFCFASLISFHSQDPSFNVAINAAPQNLGGTIGAYFADLFLQFFGIASGLLVVVLAVWSVKILLNSPIRQTPLKCLLLPILLFASSMLASFFPIPDQWPLLIGLGGAIGPLLVDILSNAFPFLQSQGFLSIPLGFMTLFLTSYLLGIRFKNWLFVGHILYLIIKAFVTGIAYVFRKITQPKENIFISPATDKKRPLMTSSTPLEAGGEEALSISEREEEAKERPEINLRHIINQAKKKAPEKPRPQQAPALSLDIEAAHHLPPLDLLVQSKNVVKSKEELDFAGSAEMLKSVLDDFGIKGDILSIKPGPVVTLYELQPAPGTKSSRVISLADDISRSMSAVSARISVIPGKNAIGIELPNEHRETVYLRELLESEAYSRLSLQLPLTLGKDISGAAIIADLAKMPHLLVAGTTGAGKSVSINTMILSLLYSLPPEQCRFIMIDPKMLELSVYDGIPHLLAPVVTEPKKAVVALKWTVREMENRYRAMSKLGVRNIDGYNLRLREALEKDEKIVRKVQTGFDKDTGEPIFEEQPLALEPMPYIVVVVDEMADLMLVAGKEIETTVQRLAQMARAAGIHLIMATQRPSVDVITGTIKANFPTRIAFQVTSKIDSRTILGEPGAEQLLGQGDMLYSSSGKRILRVHGPYVSDREVEKVVEFLKTQSEPSYIESITEDADTSPLIGSDEAEEKDDLYDQAVALVCREKKASTSFIQRRFQIGYNRAARLIEQMEEEGVISPANHVGKREILAPSHSD